MEQRMELMTGPSPRPVWASDLDVELLTRYHIKLESIWRMRQQIAAGRLTMAEVNAIAQEVQARVTEVELVVAELRRRGYTVEWET
jgi:hypothetical protein